MNDYSGTKIQRRNLLKLADYLESLPYEYEHFNMGVYASHYGSHRLPMEPELMAARKPGKFFNDCGTVACALGHGPASGVKPRPDEFYRHHPQGKPFGVGWAGYAQRAFGVDGYIFSYLFAGIWDSVDNHHWGAAARIRYMLANEEIPMYDPWYDQDDVDAYAPYRKSLADVR